MPAAGRTRGRCAESSRSQVSRYSSYFVAACAAEFRTRRLARDRTTPASGSVLWQGFIAPITFLVSLFNDSVGIYEVHNNGGWYDFGFLIGVSIFFSAPAAGAGGRARSGRRRTR